MTRKQFAFRKDGFIYEIGLIGEDGRFVGIATAEVQSWANDITVALNNQPEREGETVVSFRKDVTA